MKHYTNLFRGYGLALLSAALLFSCSQVDTFESADLQAEAEATASGFNLIPFGMGGNENAALKSCLECITVPEVAVSSVAKTTGNTTTKHGDLSVWNTETDLIVTFAFDGDEGADGSSITITDPNNTSKTYSWIKGEVPSPGISEVVTSTKNGKILSYKVTHPLSAKTACSEYSVAFASNGGPGGSLDATTTYAIYEYCKACDGETFSYVTSNENKNVIFKYDAATKLIDAEVEFTFAQIQNFVLDGNDMYTAPDGKKYSVNNPTNQTVFTWTGDIGCTDQTATTFAFEFSPDCSSPSSNDGKARIWSDTKVNGVSVKNSNTPNITFEGCPVK